MISVKTWLTERSQRSVVQQLRAYFTSLFPLFTWLPNYNVTWLMGDLVAGLTVGCVVVPQSMSYAQLASLPAQYGLYSSFVGVLIYCFFATSKDVTIGPVAVMSLEVAKVISDVQAQFPGVYTGPQIASMLALLCGAVVLGIGLFRLGWFVEFIPVPAVAGFMTGSAIKIAAGQLPHLLGTKALVDTRDATYSVVVNTLRALPKCSVDAAFGLVTLFLLYFFRWYLNNLSGKYPNYRRAIFFALVMRSGVIIILATMVSWLVCKGKKPYPIAILQTVPRGFQDVGPPVVSRELAAAVASKLLAALVILVLEHIAIAKSFGRINSYKIVPDQELIAIGLTNMLGVFFGAYPSTGSFSRSAIKSKSGVRTPLAGIFTGILVLMALYALTDAFYWIPNGALAAIIIHAVGDLIATPRQVTKFWEVSPMECGIFIVGVVVTLVSSVEYGILSMLIASVGLLLLRIALPGGQFLGLVRINSQSEDRSIFVPLDRQGVNPSIRVENPPPGILIYRMEESFIYPNASRINDRLVDRVKSDTRPRRSNHEKTNGSMAWNEVKSTVVDSSKPVLCSIILDFSSVPSLDATGVQALVDTREQVEKYAQGRVNFHFASILSPWIKRALLAGGFGADNKGLTSERRVIEVAAVVPVNSDATFSVDKQGQSGPSTVDFSSPKDKLVPLMQTNTPFFHIDLDDALSAAINDRNSRDEHVV